MQFQIILCNEKQKPVFIGMLSAVAWNCSIQRVIAFWLPLPRVACLMHGARQFRAVFDAWQRP